MSESDALKLRLSYLRPDIIVIQGFAGSAICDPSDDDDDPDPGGGEGFGDPTDL